MVIVEVVCRSRRSSSRTRTRTESSRRLRRQNSSEIAGFSVNFHP